MYRIYIYCNDKLYTGTNSNTVTTDLYRIKFLNTCSNGSAFETDYSTNGQFQNMILNSKTFLKFHQLFHQKMESFQSMERLVAKFGRNSAGETGFYFTVHPAMDALPYMKRYVANISSQIYIAIYT